MSWSSVVMYQGLVIFMLCLMQCSAKCEAPSNCSIIHNCTADTGLVDLTCYDLTSDSHRCGYRRAAPTELGVKVPQQNDVRRYNRIPDANMKASSNKNLAKLARIGLAKDQVWCAAGQDTKLWVEVDLGVPTDVERIEVEGNPQKSNWVQKFSVSYYNGSHMIPYRNGHIFTATPNDMCHYVFINRTTIIRIISKTAKPCLRLAIYGNPPVVDVPVVKQFPPVMIQPTAKLIRQDSLLEKGYHLWAIFLGVFLFLLIFSLAFILCWCCRRPREFEPRPDSKEVTTEKQQNYVPSWRTVDAKAEHGYISVQEVQEVKIAFSNEYIPPDLKTEKTDPNDENHYKHKIFSFRGWETGTPPKIIEPSAANGNVTK